MTTCRATHPQADMLAAAGVAIAACSLNQHAEGPHYFEVSANQPPSVWEPWQPKPGDYVRVDVSPECQALHAHIPLGIGAVYGRVEIVDRTWDDPDAWITAGLRDGEDVADMLESARSNRGHFFYVSDALDGSRYLLIDGHHAAAELTPVSATEAIAGIERLRGQVAAMSPAQKFLTRLGLAEVRRAS